MPPVYESREDELRHLSRLETYRQYRRANREVVRAKGRQRMAKLRKNLTEEQRQRHRDAQARYRERFREEITQRARRAAAKKNARAGKETKLRPKARQYWSPDEQNSSDDEEDAEW